jgi:hypothetical protein
VIITVEDFHLAPCGRGRRALFARRVRGNLKKDFEMRKSYPSDISREQFEKIEPLLISARKITAPRKLDLYDVFCAVLYLLKTGCQWRMLPSDFPKWRSVHAYFQIWSEQINDRPSLLEQILKKIGSTNSS